LDYSRRTQHATLGCHHIPAKSLHGEQSTQGDASEAKKTEDLCAMHLTPFSIHNTAMNISQKKSGRGIGQAHGQVNR
jgi:hypothetical protein